MTDYVNELRLMAEDIYSGVGSVPEVKTLSSAADEIERLRKDAARYRYLRDRNREECINTSGPEAGAWIDCEDEYFNLVLLTDKDADDFIDEAMNAYPSP